MNPYDDGYDFVSFHKTIGDEKHPERDNKCYSLIDGLWKKWLPIDSNSSTKIYEIIIGLCCI